MLSIAPELFYAVVSFGMFAFAFTCYYFGILRTAGAQATAMLTLAIWLKAVMYCTSGFSLVALLMFAAKHL
jgi:hypothetical protein